MRLFREEFFGRFLVRFETELVRRRRILRGLLIVASILLFAACGEHELPEERVARAHQHINDQKYRSAVIELKSLLDNHPDNAQARWLLGEIYLEFEDGPSAEKEFRRAKALGVGDDAVVPVLARALLLQEKNEAVIELQPDDELSRRSLAGLNATKGLARIKMKDLDSANMLIKAAVAADPDSPWTRLAEAKLLFVEKRYSDLEVVLAEMLETDPDNGAAWALLGDVKAASRSFAEAELAYTEAVNKKRVNGAELVKRGSARLGQEDLKGASADADLLEKRGENSSVALYFRGLVRFQQARFAEAEEVLESVHARNDRHFPTTFLLAATHWELSNWERARALSEKVVALAPRFIAGRKLLASIYLQQREGEKAIDTIGAVVHARPKDLEARRLYAAGLMQQGRTQEAASYYEEIAAVQEDHAYSQLQAGLALLSAGDDNKAIDALEKASDLAPEDANIQAASIAGLLSRKLAAEALVAAVKFAELRPAGAQAWSLLGSAYLQNGQPRAAGDAFEKALALSPGHPSATKGLVKMAIEKKDLVTARSYLESSLDVNSGDAALSVLLADIAYWEKNPAEAKAILLRALNSEPKQPAPRVAMARLLLDDGDAEEAADLLVNVSLNESPSAALVRAEALIRLRRYGEARVLLEQLAERIPESPQAHFALAVIYSELGEPNLLKKSLDRLLVIAPDLPVAQLAKARLLAIEQMPDEALALLDGLDLPAADPAMLKTRLFIARGAGKREMELDYARQLFRTEPSTTALVAFAAALGRSGAPDKMQAVLTDWAESNPGDVVVMHALSGALMQSGKITDAIAIQERILAQEPDNVMALNNLAWELRGRDLKKALAYGQRAYEISPDSLAVVDTYAEVLARNGKLDLALLLIDGEIRKISGQSELALRRAEILNIAGARAQAIQELESLLASTAAESLKARARTLISEWRG